MLKIRVISNYFCNRGSSTAYSVFAIPVVIHSFLRHNIMGYRWMLLGIAISGVIIIFGFYNASELTKNTGVAADTMSDLASGEIFALVHFSAWPVLLVPGWYLATPFPCAIIASLIVLSRVMNQSLKQERCARC